MSNLHLRISSVVAAAALISSCTLQDVDPPLPTGPSTLGLSLNVTASPDVLPEDGKSVSVIKVVARGPNGQPLPNVPLRVDTTIGSTIVDYGQLSAREVVTNGNGEATVVYVAPTSPRQFTDFGNVVNITVRPISGDFGSTSASGVSIRLVPETKPADSGAPHANFFFTPNEPRAKQQVQFDASASFDPDGQIVEYRWDYGDGDPIEKGMLQQHDFEKEGTFLVTLTVIDNQGKSASLSRSITVIPSS